MYTFNVSAGLGTRVLGLWYQALCAKLLVPSAWYQVVGTRVPGTIIA